MANPRLIYNDIYVDFPRGVKNLGQDINQTVIRNKSDSGILEHNSFFSDEIIRFFIETYDAFFETELQKFFEYMKSGQTGQLYIDPDIVLYLPFSGKSLNSNDGNYLAFERSNATGTYLDRSTGLIKTVAANIPRFQAGKYKDAILIERELVNLLDNTETFGSVNWTKSGITVTVDQSLAPDGNKTADLLTATSPTGTVQYTTATTIGTNDGVFSVWLKKATTGDENVTVWLNIGDDSPTILKSEVLSVGADWVRYTAQFPTAGNNANNWVVQIEIIDNTKKILAWGAQLEPKYYPTSYVADNETRGADKLRYDLSDTQFNNNIYSLSLWLKVPYDHDELDSDRYLVLFYDEANSQEVLKIEIESGSSGFTFTGYDHAGATAISSTIATSALTKNVWHYIVITVDINGDGEIKLYIDGTYINNINYYPFTAWETPDELILGSAEDGMGGQELDGMICDVILENRLLTAAEIASRYAFSYGLGIKRNRYDNVFLNSFDWVPDRRNGVPRFSQTLEFINQNT